jgi:CheY-like chemotaxis protein
MHNPPVILIADDDHGFQEIIGTKLKRNGFLVAEAHDGKEAVEKADNLEPDLILMDINMPGESGTEAVLDIKKNIANKDVKILFLTSETNPWPALKKDGEEAQKNENKEVASELGASNFISKSEDVSVIVDLVKQALKQ